MLVCWDWLSEYVELSVGHEDLALRFAMSGLNHESTEAVGGDVVIDLEVTSNRGDCLGHIGVAREASVLLGKPLAIPGVDSSKSVSGGSDVAEYLEVENHFEAGCPQYTARVIRNVKIGASPDWLVRRLAAIGINSVNNVVDITNYVMMECGQPLHAFDLKNIRGGKIVVRPAKDKEKFLAIDHKTYELDSQMIVIADAERAVALGGVMGGADSEVTEATTDLLIEAARFQPLPIRRAARKLKLHSPSSYRFERSPDPDGLEWASLRCCQMILELAGGELCGGVVSAGEPAGEREPIEFRLHQIKRVLGIEVPVAEVHRILGALGCTVTGDDVRLSVTPPSWRGDLQREVDLIEEVARIHGYEQIPENVAVPIGVASPRPKDVVLDRLRHTLSAYGVDEAMTPSLVQEGLEHFGSVWTGNAPLMTETPLLVGSRVLRRSIVPSLLAARQTNQAQSIRNAQLYEVANVYLPGSKEIDLPKEQSTLGVVTEGNLQLSKGIIEQLVEEIAGVRSILNWQPMEHAMFEDGTSQSFAIGEETLGHVGLVSGKVLKSLGLEGAVAAAEVSVDGLVEVLQTVRTAIRVSAFPAVVRDLNFVVDEALTWAQLSGACKASGGEQLQKVEYVETYRDAKKDGADKKRILLTLHFQSLDRTLTGDEVDAAVTQIISACESKLGGKLLG